MPSMGEGFEPGGDGVIETASATTSPDNAQSGPAAYVITVAALVSLTLLLLALGGCVGMVAGAVGRRSTDGYLGERYYDDDPYGLIDEFEDDWDDLGPDYWDLEEFLRENEGSDGRGGDGPGGVEHRPAA